MVFVSETKIKKGREGPNKRKVLQLIKCNKLWQLLDVNRNYWGFQGARTPGHQDTGHRTVNAGGRVTTLF